MANLTTPAKNPRLVMLKNAITDKPELHATFEKLFTDNNEVSAAYAKKVKTLK